MQYMAAARPNKEPSQEKAFEGEFQEWQQEGAAASAMNFYLKHLAVDERWQRSDKREDQ
jgi:hypothetical protein